MNTRDAVRVVHSSLFPKTFPDNNRKNVLHIALSPIAGSPLRISNVIADTSLKYNSILASQKFSYQDGRSFDFDVYFNKTSWLSSLKKLLIKADIVHFHNESFFELKDLLRNDLSGKKLLLQWHSGIDEMSYKTGLSETTFTSLEGVQQLVIAQAQRNDYPLAKLVPNVPHLRGFKADYVPLDLSEVVRIVYAPTSIESRFRCGKKGQSIVLKALKEVEIEFKDKVSVNIVRGVDLKRCLKVKAASHIGLDDILSGGYHLSTLENLYCGLLNINNFSEDTLGTLKELGRGELAEQCLDSGPNNLVDTLSNLISNKDKIESMRKSSYDWMKMYWDEKWCCSRYESIYDEL